ncbi:MAG: Ig-like domain-containing protein [Bacteroidales bacterium]|jgi:hypothetical protein|nr:Ig-like domain-containing protein [Bacteroidales bacterium]
MAKCTVAVTARETENETVAVTGVTLSKTTLTLETGMSATLAATVAPADATDKTVTLTSSNHEVATVAGDTVTAVGVGTATITSTTRDGNFKAACTITVNEPAPRITMTMTTGMEGEVTILLAGTGTATINWGDGSEPETVTLTEYNGWGWLAYNMDYNAWIIPHTYALSADPITVTITGNVTGMKSPYTGEYGSYLKERSLESLDVSRMPGLLSLSISNTNLQALDVSKNTELNTLLCHNNNIQTLDISKNTALRELHCDNNQFDAAGLDALFNTLHSNYVAGWKTIGYGLVICSRSLVTYSSKSRFKSPNSRVDSTTI